MQVVDPGDKFKYCTSYHKPVTWHSAHELCNLVKVMYVCRRLVVIDSPFASTLADERLYRGGRTIFFSVVLSASF